MSEKSATKDTNLVGLVRELARGEIGRLKSARQATIIWALVHTRGNVAKAAAMLGTSRSTVYRCVRATHFRAA